jgi:hypothetical protein
VEKRVNKHSHDCRYHIGHEEHNVVLVEDSSKDDNSDERPAFKRIESRVLSLELLCFNQVSSLVPRQEPDKSIKEVEDSVDESGVKDGLFG